MGESEAWESLTAIGAAAMGLNVGTMLVVGAMAVMVMVTLRRVVGTNLEQIAENLPKVVALIEASELDMAVLIAGCEEKGTTAEELAAMFKEDQDRKAVVQRRFGSKSRLSKRFLAWTHSKILQEGYPAEKHLKEYLDKASTNKETTCSFPVPLLNLCSSSSHLPQPPNSCFISSIFITGLQSGNKERQSLSMSEIMGEIMSFSR